MKKLILILFFTLLLTGCTDPTTTIVDLDSEDDIKIELVEGELYDMNEILKNPNKKISLKQSENSWIYYIEKRDLIYNMFDFGKLEGSVIKWLAKKMNAEKLYK